MGRSMRNLLRLNSGDFGLSAMVVTGLVSLGLGYMAHRSMTNAYKKEGQLEYVQEEIKMEKEQEAEDTKIFNTHKVKSTIKKRELEKDMRSDDPKKRAEAVFKSLGRH